jgi:hypothetical protein
MSCDHDEAELRQLADLCRRSPLPMPTEEDWAGALARVEEALPPRRPQAGAGWWGPLAGAAAVAAVVSLALLRQAPAPPAPAPAADDGPWEVASASEVQILGVVPAEADLLALGRPTMGDFTMAAPDDIKVLNTEPNPDGETRPELDLTGPLPVIDWAAQRDGREPEPK